MKSISVIIPTFNRRSLLSRSLASVLCQKRVPDEILVVDDGSSDGTREFLHANFPQIKYSYQENQGPAAARNTGVRQASGEWIAFLDSDDEWTPEKLSVQENYLKENLSCRIVQTEEIWIRNGKRVNPMKKHRKYSGWIFEKCLALCIVSPSAVMIQKSLFDDIGLFNESYPACEDYELWLRIASRFPIDLIDKACVIKYGGHEDQRSREFPAMDRFRIRAISELIESGHLTPEQNEAAQTELQSKLDIYITGAKKRGRANIASTLESLTKQKNFAALDPLLEPIPISSLKAKF